MPKKTSASALRYAKNKKEVGMTAFATQWVRRGVACLAVLVLTASVAFGQKAPSPGTHITVSKTTTPTADMPDVGMFKTIQEAVNAATSGQVIEILDTGVYEEQVTIDGRDVSPWDGNNGGSVKKVVGKKNGITIRYVPSASERASGNYKRPTIKYKDTQNQSPKTVAESKTGGELPGSSGNFETCGALRIIRAQGVTIDGIAVDGGGQALFAWSAIWNSKDALVHGNAAIALVVAGGAIIRNCDLRNAYIGINVKDRNTGGVFGMRNPADPEDPVPLSGFGRVGYHLIEYNRIHDNALGIFFESAWDLGSTVRYNLIYNNVNDATSKTFISSSSFPSDAKNNMASGAMMFKDMVYSPVAIYNNTFYRNEMNFIGHWKVGAPHLLFNNIFGKSTVQTTTNGGNAPQFGYDFMAMDGAFQYRMHNSTFSAYLKIDAQGQSVYVDYTCSPQNYDTLWIRDATIWNAFGTPAKSKLRIDYTYCGKSKEEDAVVPGALLTGGARGFSSSANVRWLEMSKQTVTAEQSAKSLVLPDLFLSTDTANPKFLWPDWEHQYVKDYIQNKGWETVGIRNADNKIADLGAISSNNDVHQPTLVRIKPTNVVLLSGTTAKASFFLTLESGTMTNPKIKFLRWVAPLPNNFSNFGGSDAPVIPEASIRNITPPTTTLNFGSNNFDFTVPQMTMRDSLFGFFEIVVEGTGANGQVVSDVGFLPYRNLDYKLDIRVFAGNATSTTGPGLDTVRAGETYKVVVIPQRSNGNAVQYTLNEVTYDLLSDATAFMYRPPASVPPQNPLTEDTKLSPQGKTYDVYFTRAGAETIMGAGVYDEGANHLVFLGTKDLTVKPGVPDHIVFLDPIPSSQLGGAPAQVINRGVDKPVTVEVQDKYGNAVDVPTPVSIVSDKPDVGDVGAPGAIGTKSVTTGTDGVARFIAKATNGKTGDIFEMTASITVDGAKKEDVGRLRLGRALDRLEVFYSDTTAAGYDPDAKISGGVGDWFKVTVKVMVTDSVNTAHTSPKVVSVSADNDDGLVFSATSGGAPATEFPLNNGVATFWISGTKDVTGACIDVEALVGPGGAVDGGISPGNRCDITFIKPSSSILRAVVYGDGHGRPDSLLIYYVEGDAKFTGPNAVPKPDKVTLAWPTAAAGVVMTANAAAIDIRGDYLLHVNLAGAALSGGTAKPRGYTTVERKIVTVYGEGEDDGFDVIDGIGPVIGVDNDEAAVGSPILTENMNAGTDDDVITIKVSEQLRNPESLKGKTLFYTKDANPANEPGASGGDELEVVEAFLVATNTYQVTVKAVAGGLQPGYWIRFNPSGGVADRAKVDGVIEDNTPHPGNRWAPLKLQEVAPSVIEAWYTSNVTTTGFPDYAYVRFDKNVVLADWFSDGSVNFGKNDVVNVAAAGLASLFSASGDTLIINLATAFKSSQTSIRTSEDMPFTLGYASGKKDEWEGAASVDVLATDRAKPVLADTVFLYIGDFKEDGSTTDTLRVTYSEQPSDTAVVDRPVTIIKKDGSTCEPVLKLFGQIVPVGGSSRYYKATYLIEGDLAAQCPAFPETGDWVRIDAAAGFRDNRQPPNIQDVADNLRQPLKVVRELKWSVKVKGNPFKSDAAGSSKVKVEISPNAPPGVNRVNIDATIMVFDNLGSLVRVDTLKNAGENKIEWPWDGTNQKGRLVGTGTYLFKALCRVQIVNDGGGAETMPSPPAVVRSLGVIRGRN